MVRHFAVEAEPAEPAVGEVQVHLLAPPPFGANAVAVAEQQHPGRAVRDQSKAGRSSYKMAPDGPEPLTNRQRINRPSANGRNMSLKGELVKQCRPTLSAEDPSSIQISTTGQFNRSDSLRLQQSSFSTKTKTQLTSQSERATSAFDPGCVKTRRLRLRLRLAASKRAYAGSPRSSRQRPECGSPFSWL